ncbi:MAG: hypothetical protein ACE5OY_03330 [Candidatus Bathyarchaeia archaeon]
MDEPNEGLRLTYRDAFVVLLVFNAFLHAFVIYETAMWTWAPGDDIMRWTIEFCELFREKGLTNVWTPYPQGANLIYHLLFSLASLGPWRDMLFWMLWKIFLHIIPDVLTLLTIYLIGRELAGERIAFLASMYFTFSFAPYLYGLLTNFVYDPFPVFLTVLGLYLLIRRKLIGSAVVIGIGTAVKLFPASLLIVGLRLFKGRRRIRFAITSLMLTSVILLPFAIANPPIFVSTYHWQSGRPPWETLYSYVLAAIDAPFSFDQPYYRDYFASNSGWLFWGITPNPNTLTTPIPPQPTRWWNVTSLLGFALMLSPLLLASVRESEEIIGWVTYVFLAFFLWNIGWSPQYELFVIPLLLYSYGNRIHRAGAVSYLLQGTVLLEYSLSPPGVIQVGGVASFKILFGLLRYSIFAFTLLQLFTRGVLKVR